MLLSHPPERAAPDDDPWVAPLTILVLVTVEFGLPLLLRCGLDSQVDYNEGWNAYRQQAAALWQPLYAAMPGTEITNYPPLSFHLVGLLGRLCGNMLLAGRLVSLLAIATIGLAAARIGQNLSGSRALGACCGLSWIAGIEFWTPSRIGADDPQLLAMAIQALGLLVFLRQPARAYDLVLSAMLVSLGLFAKHSLLALPIGMTLSLAMSAAWRPLAVWLLTGLTVCLGLFAASLALDGQMFLMHLLAPRLFLPRQALELLGLYVLLSAPALVVVVAWIWLGRATAVALPLVLAWITSLLEIAAFAGGDGVANSIYQDAILLNAVLQPLSLQWILAYRARRGRSRCGNVLVLMSLLPGPLLLAALTPSSWQALQQMERQQQGVRQAVSLLRAQQGPVACEALLLCFQAAKPSAFDAYYVLDQIRLGRMPSERIDRLLDRQELAAIEVGTPDDPEPAEPTHQPRRFSRSFMVALWAHYRPVLSSGGLTLFVPSTPAAAGIGTKSTCSGAFCAVAHMAGIQRGPAICQWVQTLRDVWRIHYAQDDIGRPR